MDGGLLFHFILSKIIFLVLSKVNRTLAVLLSLFDNINHYDTSVCK